MADAKVTWLALDTASTDVKVSWLAFDTSSEPCDVRVSWLCHDTASATCDVKVSWVCHDTSSSTCDVKVSWLCLDTAATVTGVDGDGSKHKPRKFYLRRKGKILLFDTAAQADDYLEAEEEAQKAIQAAKSRGAKKRIAAKILKAVEPVESVEIAPLQEMVKAYSVPVDLPTLLKQNDYSQVMKVREMIQRMLDDEDDELLLLLA